MASDVACFHNLEIPEDTDGSGAVTPLDALVVINRLNSSGLSDAAVDTVMSDVDADATTSPLDALIVINLINRNAASAASDTTSEVPVANRIARIEQMISGGTLASKFTLDDAISILATLRSGGRPEVGDRMVGGELVHHGGNRESFLEHLTEKLTDAGVSSETITTITDEISAAQTSGTPLTLTQIKTRLTELGVDIAKVFPVATDNHSDKFLERLTSKLTDAGVSADTIATISTEITDAQAAGTPLTLDQVKARLTELGVDVTKIFTATTESHLDRFVERLTSKLSDAGVTDEIITTISTEIKDAAAAGSPLTLDQIKTRLTELGVDVTSLFPRLHENQSGTERSDGFLSLLSRKLTALGVSADTITTITTEIQDAKSAGTPLTVTQIKARLVELGVDVSTLDLTPRTPRAHRGRGRRG
jgi:SOS response regulatory protein OraA/RecX